MVLHNIPYLNDPSKAEQAQPGSRLVLSGSRLREMNLYSEMVRDTSINAVSTPKYHPLPACSRPTEGLAGFFLPSAGSRTGIEGEKDISDTRISDSFRRPCLPDKCQAGLTIWQVYWEGGHSAPGDRITRRGGPLFPFTLHFFNLYSFQPAFAT